MTGRVKLLSHLKNVDKSNSFGSLPDKGEESFLHHLSLGRDSNVLQTANLDVDLSDDLVP